MVFSLRAAFRAALGPATPVREHYIQRVEELVSACQARGIRYLATSGDAFEHDGAVPLTPELRVFNKNMMLIKPWWRYFCLLNQLVSGFFLRRYYAFGAALMFLMGFYCHNA